VASDRSGSSVATGAVCLAWLLATATCATPVGNLVSDRQALLAAEVAGVGTVGMLLWRWRQKAADLFEAGRQFERYEQRRQLA